MHLDTIDSIRFSQENILGETVVSTNYSKSAKVQNKRNRNCY